MLITFSGNSNRVKGLCFHPKRPWLLTSLHNGAIQLWDYRMKTLLDQFTEHEGPVRGIDFHKSQPLFVSGGDDYKIKVWNYKLRRCLFTLQGHLDYIRTVEFHVEQPWIVSASDDYTIRIWNWQSRQCIAVLTGHNYYVMCASFHPTEDLLVSASLDQTVRVWDTSGLKKSGKNMSDDFMRMNQLNQDLFGTNDVMVKYILEGHERGVNWASFHPTQNYIVSAADDKTIRLWKYNDTRAWEADVLVGHSNNVSCVKFHAKKGFIVSNSEDKTVRVYNMNKNNSFLQSYQRENDRFWILGVHPNQNLMAAGHDNGFVIFKLERERPPFVTIKNQMYFVKDKYLRKYDCEKNADFPIATLKRSTTTTPKVLQYNSQENLALIVSGVGEHSTWELFALTTPKNTTTTTNNTSETNLEQLNPTQKGKGIAAVFVGLKKFAILSSNKLKIQLKQVDKDVTKEMDAPISPLENIFQATSGRILLKSDDKVYLFDFEQQSIIAQVSALNVRSVVWSEDGSRVALLSKHSLVIVNSKLEVLCSLKETVAIKSGAFDEVGVFLYTTLNHLKYCLPNGDNGTIKTLVVPYYIAKVRNNGIHIIDRESNVHLTFIDATEYRFKLALLSGKTHEIKSIIGQSKILGDSIIAYLEQKGYPNIAMKFVQDDQTKFDLALKSGHIEQALQAAMNLDKKENWIRLGLEALEQGNSVQIVERAYQKTKEFEKLSFLYLLLGSNSYLQKMLQIAQKREDTMSRFHNALLLGNVEARIKILMENNQWALAFASAKQHGLVDLAQQCASKLDNAEQILSDELSSSDAQLLLPPIPVYANQQNWPKLNSSYASALEEEEMVVDDHDLLEDQTGNWEGIQIPTAQDELLLQDKQDESHQQKEDEEAVGGWEGLEEITDVEHLNSGVSGSANEHLEDFSAPIAGRSLAEYWIENSASAVDHIAAGHFDSACQLLTNAFGVTQFGPLKTLFQTVYMGSRCVMPITPLQPCISILLQRNMMNGDNEENKNNSLPMIAGFDLNDLTEKSKTALKTVTLGKFEDAQKMFREVMHQLLFVNLSSKKDEREAKDLLKVCSEYTAALRLEIIRNSLKNNDPKKSAELAAYFTKCKLNSSHIMLILNSAMSVNLKIENYATAALFAKRLLSMGPIPKLADQAKFVIQKAEQNPQDKYELNYDDRNPFVVCCHSLTPIYAGSESISCSYCGAPYLPKYKGENCTVCEIAEIGKQVAGLQVFKPIKTQ